MLTGFNTGYEDKEVKATRRFKKLQLYLQHFIQRKKYLKQMYPFVNSWW